MRYIVLIDRDRNESYESYINSIYYTTPSVCVYKDWGSNLIYYHKLILK